MLQASSRPQRKSTNVSLDSKLVEEAKKLGVNMSRSAEEGIAKAVSDEKSRRWLLENEEALESSNEYVRRNGLPLAKHRPF